MSQAIAHRPALVGAADGHPALDRAAGEQRRPIVVVLGMHSSGTSLCSHVLSVLGVDMTDALDIQPSNPHGHWERLELKAFHDQILELLGRGYYSPTHDLPLPIAWWADPRVRAIRQAIVAFLRRRVLEGCLFGFKDPRTARLLPVWHEVFEELKLTPKFVLCLRNPAQVARSLAARDGLDPERGEYRWFRYMVEMFANLRNQQLCTIEYEDWFGDTNINLHKLAHFLDLSWERSPANLRAVISHIVDSRLRHDGTGNLESHQPLVRSLYAMARGLGEDAAVERIGALVDQFAAYQDVHLPLYQGFEKALAQAAALPERERELAELRGEAESIRAERDAALAQAEKMEARLAAAQAELAAERDRGAAALASLDRAQAELAAREAALARAEEALSTVAAEVEKMEARLAAAQAELAAERDRGAAALASLDRAQAELAAREAALERAEQRAAALEEIAEAAQAAVDALRTKLAEVEQQGAERIALAESEHDRLTDELDRLAEERDRLAAESDQWFDAAILSAMQPVIAAHSARGWRIGRHVLRLDRVRGKGSPMQRADAARAAHQWARAARFYLEALGQLPTRAAVWVQLGHALKEAGRRTEAESAYRRAVDLDRANLDALVPLGQLLRERDQYAEAAAAYRRAVALDPPAELRAFLASELAVLNRRTEPAP